MESQHSKGNVLFLLTICWTIQVNANSHEKNIRDLSKEEKELLAKATLPSFCITEGVTVLWNKATNYVFLAEEISEINQHQSKNHSHIEVIGDIPK